MIVIDYSQTIISNLMAEIGNRTDVELDVNLLRHMVINTIRSHKVKFGKEYGDVVIACDSRKYWRKEVFPYYKANRKKSQEKSELDWKAIFECMNKIRAELKEFFPYKVIDIESAEADDIIATLVKHKTDEDVLILSGDKDFIQLHTYPHVKQYDPTRKKWIQHDDPERYLLEHVLKGDSSDGVPNVLSDDNCFVIGLRQKPLTQKKIDDIIANGWRDMDERLFRNYKRNAQLIDLTFIPEDLVSKIIDTFDSMEARGRDKLMNYFITNKLKNLMGHIGEF
jgi:5'-3' exonuclease